MESIKENQEKSNRFKIKTIFVWYCTHRIKILVSIIVFLFGCASFGLGWLFGMNHKPEPIKVIKQELLNPSLNQAVATTSTAIAPIIAKNYVASKTGKAYYLPWCGTVSRIKEENKVWFDSKESAEKAGYRPAVNCPGL